MTRNSPEKETGAKRSAIIIWWAMAVGPALFFGSLLSIGVWLFGLDRRWWGSSDDPPSDFVLFGPMIAVTLAELAGAIIASARRPELAGTELESHTTSALRTFWIMATVFVGANCVALLLLLIPNINAIGFSLGAMCILAFAIPLLFVWKTFRVIRGLRRASEGKPITDHPTRWS